MDTTQLVQGARSGDPERLDALIRRFSPWLLALARFRLPHAVRAEAEDVVHDVWLRSLPVLPTLEARDGRYTPVVMRFLGTTLLYRTNELRRESLRRAGRGEPLAPSRIPDPTAGAVTRIACEEGTAHILAAIDALPDLDRQVVLLRVVEQHSNAAVAEAVGQTPNAVSLRFNRALERLRRTLGPSLLDELTEPPVD